MPFNYRMMLPFHYHMISLFHYHFLKFLFQGFDSQDDIDDSKEKQFTDKVNDKLQNIISEMRVRCCCCCCCCCFLFFFLFFLSSLITVVAVVFRGFLTLSLFDLPYLIHSSLPPRQAETQKFADDERDILARIKTNHEEIVKRETSIKMKGEQKKKALKEITETEKLLAKVDSNKNR